MAEESPRLAYRVSTWLVRWRWFFFGLAVAATAAGVWPSMQLRFEADVTGLFPPDDPVLVGYQTSTELFGGEQLVVLAFRDPDLLSAEGL